MTSVLEDKDEDKRQWALCTEKAHHYFFKRSRIFLQNKFGAALRTNTRLNVTSVYYTVCYRTPSVEIYGSPNHDLLKELMQELSVTKKHFLLMGDFNYRYQTWPPLQDNVTKEAAEFYCCLEDNFSQHVAVFAKNDTILDLVITHEPHRIVDVEDLGLFPGSDHNALCCQLVITTYREISHS